VKERPLPDDFRGLHVLADDDPRWGADPVAVGEAGCRGGAAVIQLRAKHATDSQTLDWARALREVTRRHGARLVVNDRFDLALAAEADAVHLGQGDLPPAALPARARGLLAVGRSTHTLDQLRAALAEPVDYLAYGPVFGTQSKPSEYSRRGLEQLAAAAKEMDARPLVAIGGITEENLAAVVEAGADGAAVISAVMGTANPEAATHRLVDVIAQALARRVYGHDRHDRYDRYDRDDKGGRHE
jgi:thiamine-phosphate pyrophosphorylase